MNRQKEQVQSREALTAKIQSRVNQILGDGTRGFNRYNAAYEKEFIKNWKIEKKTELMKQVRAARLVLVGDFHALRQSQRVLLRVLRELKLGKGGLVLGLECFARIHQKWIDQLTESQISERDFLKAIEWKNNWGFPWENYRPIIRWAIKNKVKIVGLNLITKERSSKTLFERDIYAANVLSEVHAQNPESKIVVMIGDLHLAEGHLPKQIDLLLPKLKVHRITLFQNSERIYFQLMRQGIDHGVDIVRLSKKHFCLLSVPPWVKWQNYLIFIEKNSDLGFDDEGFEVTDHVAEFVNFLSDELGLPTKCDDFVVEDTLNSSEMRKIKKTFSEAKWKVLKLHFENESSFYIPEARVAYLSRSSVNHTAHLAMNLIHMRAANVKKTFLKFPENFQQQIWLEAIAYFGTKILNPKRKTSTLADIKQAVLQNQLDQEIRLESLQIALLQKMQDYLMLSGQGRYRELPKRASVVAYLEAAKLLGGMLGEKLFYAYSKRIVSLTTVQHLIRKNLDGVNFKNAYLEIVDLIESFPEPFRSKKERI